MVRIENNGPDIRSTDYWQSEIEAEGISCVSFHAGCFRVLMARKYFADLPEMKTAGEVLVLRGPWPEQRKLDAFQFIFNDGSPNPYFILFDAKTSFERLPAPSAEGRSCRVAVWAWAETGPAKVLELPAQFKRVPRVGVETQSTQENTIPNRPKCIGLIPD